MMKIFTCAAVAALLTMAMPFKVHAYGAAHAGATHAGPSGVTHVGRTAATGYGDYRGGHGAVDPYRGRYGYDRNFAGYGYGSAAAYNAAAAGASYPYVPGYYNGAPGYPYAP